MVDIQGLVTGAGDTILKTIFYILFLVIIGVGGFFITYFSAFNVKVKEIILSGSGKDGYIVSKFKNNRFKWNRAKSEWIPLYPLFNKNKVQPFDQKHVYSGNIVVAFKLGNEYIPGVIDTQTTSGQLTITPMPYHIKEWQMVQMRKNNEEFQKRDFWSQNKQAILSVATVAFCMLTVMITVYWTYQHADGVASALSGLTSKITNANIIQGVP